MFDQIPRRAVMIMVVAAAWWGAACQNRDGQAAQTQTGSTAHPIIGGELESGYGEVGALTRVVFGSYLGTFCTATLIDPSWALTAAHCLLAGDEGGSASVPTPQTTRFYLGSNAEPTGEPAIHPPASGMLYNVAAFYPHPMYASGSNNFDIGLVRLDEPILGTTPAIYNTEPLEPEIIDRQALFVGFGYSYVDGSGDNGAGQGVKRSALIGLDYFWDAIITTLGGPPGMCYGDSGGPSFLDGAIIGVNAATIDPDCAGGAILSRVDYYTAWIEDVMGGMGTSCLTDDSLCECPQACQADGSCDDAICDLLTCPQAYDCLLDCPKEDGACQVQCVSSADGKAQGRLENMLACFQYFCGDISNAAAQEACVLDNCGDEIALCGLDAPGMDCRLVGGDCAAEKTCAPVEGGVPRCHASLGQEAGASCDLETTEPLPCEDGFVCHRAEGAQSATCQPYCYEAQDCASALCDPLGEASGKSFGVCGPEEVSTDTTDTESGIVDTGTGSVEPDTVPSTGSDERDTGSSTGDEEEAKSGSRGCSLIDVGASPRSTLLALLASLD